MRRQGSPTPRGALPVQERWGRACPARTDYSLVCCESATTGHRGARLQNRVARIIDVIAQPVRIELSRHDRAVPHSGWLSRDRGDTGLTSRILPEEFVVVLAKLAQIKPIDDVGGG